MKKYAPFIILILLSVLTTAATYAPTLFKVTNMTKSVTYRVKGLHALTARMSAAGTVYLNGTGDGWPLDAGNAQDFYPFRNISTLRFTCASTAAASPVKLYTQEM